MIEWVEIDLSDRAYKIAIGQNILDSIRTALELKSVGKVILITDENVSAHYRAEILGCYGDFLQPADVLVFPAGERSKAFSKLLPYYGRLVELGCDRNSLLLALGGGVIGDITGFLASTYMRGIRFVQIPTSLLAQVDSSIGGKTGVNLESGKNLVGTFFQPVFVLTDLHFLKTLPEREYISGLAEVVKIAAVLDEGLFQFLEAHVSAILNRQADTLLKLIPQALRLKKRIVEQDEKERGVRALLNFGHTVGHAIEAAFGYQRFLHGEAVSLGLAFAAQLSANKGALSQKELQRILNLLVSLGLPVDYSRFEADLEGIIQWIGSDKKKAQGQTRFVFLKAIGAGWIESVSHDEIRAVFNPG